MRFVACAGLLAGIACARGAPDSGSADVASQVPAVQGLAASSAANAVRIDLSWQPAGVGLSYAIVRTDGPIAITLATVETTSYAVTALSPGETACFAVESRNGARSGPLSPAICAVALGVSRPPARVTAFGIASGVRIAWQAASDGPTATEWSLTFAGGARAFPASTLATEVTGLTAGTRYQFSVSARNAAGNSPPSTASAFAGVPPPSIWTEGPRVPVAAAGAMAAHGRLWVTGADGSNRERLVSARLGPEGLPGSWEDSGAPAFALHVVYTGWADAGTALLFGTGNVCCGLGTEATGEALALELRPDGSAVLAAPQAVIGPLPSNRPGLTTDGAHVFSVGGFWWSGGSFTGYGTGLPFVDVADLTPAGAVGWRRTTPLPRAASLAHATIVAGAVYALLQDGAGVWSAVHARPAADGSIASWQTTRTPGPPINALIGAAGRLYAIGSEDGALFVGSVGADGELSWSTSPAEALGASVAPPVLAGVDQRLYLLQSDLNGSSSVAVANIDPATGHLSAFAVEELAAPASVSATPTAAGTVRVTWEAVADADFYELRKMGDTASTPSSATSTTVTGLDPLASVRFEVRAVSRAARGRWMPSDAVIPWPSSTWSPSISLGGNRVYAFFAGNTLFAVAYPAPFTAPLGLDGLPWGTVGPERYGGSSPPHHSNEGGAPFAVSDSAACLVLTGGREYQDEPAKKEASISCVEDDGFEGSNLQSGVADPMPSGRFGHAAAAAGRGFYVLGGLGNDASGAVTALADVSFATFGADRSLKSWTHTTPLPGAASSLGAVAAGGRIYAVAPSFAPDRVLVADAQADGSLGVWRESGRMPYPRAAPSAIVVRDFLYVLGGGAEGTPTALIAKLDPATGASSGWSADPADSFVGQRANPSVLARGDRLYLFGNWTAPGTSALQTATIDPESGHFKRWR
jgi:hypothetical protein